MARAPRRSPAGASATSATGAATRSGTRARNAALSPAGAAMTCSPSTMAAIPPAGTVTSTPAPISFPANGSSPVFATAQSVVSPSVQREATTVRRAPASVRRERRPIARRQEVGVSSLQRGHRPEHRPVALVPADPRAEDVLPDEHPDAVQPGAPELLGVVAVPASRVVQHVALLEPSRPQHAWDAAVGEPLRPREVVVVDARQREGGLALEADSAAAPRRRPRGGRAAPPSSCRGRRRPRRAGGRGRRSPPRRRPPRAACRRPTGCSRRTRGRRARGGRRRARGSRARRGRSRTGSARRSRSPGRRARARRRRSRRTARRPRRGTARA